jgi:hypothetical protein
LNGDHGYSLKDEDTVNGVWEGSAPRDAAPLILSSAWMSDNWTLLPLEETAIFLITISLTGLFAGLAASGATEAFHRIFGLENINRLNKASFVLDGFAFVPA